MPLQVEPLNPTDIDAYLSVQCAAFTPLEADMVFPMVLPTGLDQVDKRAYLRARLLNATKDQLSSQCFVVRDTSLSTADNIVGISWWTDVVTPAKTREEVDAAYAKAGEARRTLPAVQGMNGVLYEAFSRKMFYEAWETLPEGTGPYVELRVLAIHPEHQRRGIGKLLVEHGLRRVDELGLPGFILASKGGKTLYEKFGFQVLRDFPFDARDYGGRSPGVHWTMFRPARKQVGC